MRTSGDSAEPTTSTVRQRPLAPPGSDGGIAALVAALRRRVRRSSHRGNSSGTPLPPVPAPDAETRLAEAIEAGRARPAERPRPASDAPAWVRRLAALDAEPGDVAADVAGHGWEEPLGPEDGS